MMTNACVPKSQHSSIKRTVQTCNAEREPRHAAVPLDAKQDRTGIPPLLRVHAGIGTACAESDKQQGVSRGCEGLC